MLRFGIFKNKMRASIFIIAMVVKSFLYIQGYKPKRLTLLFLFFGAI